MRAPLERFLKAFAEELGRACARAMGVGLGGLVLLLLSRL